eukprot:3840348-Alexandrium_andersonii.AAC.1
MPLSRAPSPQKSGTPSVAALGAGGAMSSAAPMALSSETKLHVDEVAVAAGTHRASPHAPRL